MSTIRLLSTGLVLCTIVLLGAEEPGDGPSALPIQTPQIRYEQPGLTSITIADGKLTYVWYTLKEQRIHRQSRESYDRQEAVITLAPSDWELTNNWMTEHAVWSLKAPNCDTGRQTYGSAFSYSLNIELGERHFGASWHGDCDTGETGRAASALVEVCGEIVKRKLR